MYRRSILNTPGFPVKESIMSNKNAKKTKDTVRMGLYRVLALVMAGLMVAGTVAMVIFYVTAK